MIIQWFGDYSSAIVFQRTVLGTKWGANGNEDDNAANNYHKIHDDNEENHNIDDDQDKANRIIVNAFN